MHKTQNPHIIYEASGAIIGISLGSALNVSAHNESLMELWGEGTTMHRSAYTRRWGLFKEWIPEWDLVAYRGKGVKIKKTETCLLRNRVLNSEKLYPFLHCQNVLVEGERWHCVVMLVNPANIKTLVSEQNLARHMKLSDVCEDSSRLYCAWGKEGLIILTKGSLSNKMETFFSHFIKDEMVVCHPLFNGRSTEVMPSTDLRVETCFNNKHWTVFTGLMLGNINKLEEYFSDWITLWEQSLLPVSY